MSIVRWGVDGSDVYVFDSVLGGLECCGCVLDGHDGPSPRFQTAEDMIVHLHRHEANGDCVPDFVFEELEEMADEGYVGKPYEENQ